MIDFDTKFSRRILIRLVVLGIVAAGLIAASIHFITALYLQNQLTDVGLIINASILGLFLLGLGRIVIILVRYASEERELGVFVRALDAEEDNPAYDVDTRALVAQRFHSIRRLTQHNVPINHGALSATLSATENTRLSFPRFVNNTLILTGVFGTIVSLSIALVGASNMLGGGEEVQNIGLVIHGMSTALSTTITAIVSYFFFAYFFLKLNDAKTHLLSGIEQVTALYLLPRYSYTRDTMLVEVADLVLGLREAAEKMDSIQTAYAAAGEGLVQAISALNERVGSMVDDVRHIKGVLREGFRLPSSSDD